MAGFEIGFQAVGGRGELRRGRQRVGTFGEWTARQTVESNWRIVVTNLELDDVWGHMASSVALVVGKQEVTLPIVSKSTATNVIIARGEPTSRRLE